MKILITCKRKKCRDKILVDSIELDINKANYCLTCNSVKAKQLTDEIILKPKKKIGKRGV